MKRGDLVTVALQGDYGKPRPASIVQSDLFGEHPSVTILPVTGELRDAPLFRIRIEPEPLNNLQTTSEIMVDKAQSVPREHMGEVIGHVTEEQILAVSRSLAVFLGGKLGRCAAKAVVASPVPINIIHTRHADESP